MKSVIVLLVLGFVAISAKSVALGPYPYGVLPIAPYGMGLEKGLGYGYGGLPYGVGLGRGIGLGKGIGMNQGIGKGIGMGMEKGIGLGYAGFLY